MNWPASNPNFYKLNSEGANIISIIGNSDLHEGFMDYALMFKDAALILTNHVLKTQNFSTNDAYFFSIAYLYRHSLELILKAIGFKYIIEKEERKTFIKETKHSLSILLETISPFLESDITNNRDSYTWIKSLFNDMNKIDKESDAFRYPFGITEVKEEFSSVPKKFVIKNFVEKQTHVNLRSFAQKMLICFDLIHSYYSDKFSANDSYKEFSPIFLEDGGLYHETCIIWFPPYKIKEFHTYVRAYSESAKYLNEYINENNQMRERIFLPICYLYKNGVELGIKEILFEQCSFDFQTKLGIIREKKHKILSLWNKIRGDIEEHNKSDKSSTTITIADDYIRKLNEIDGASDKFRYPINKVLDLHFKNKKKFDINNVVKLFDDLVSFLSAVCSQMDEQKNIRAEMEAEYQPEREYYNDYL